MILILLIFNIFNLNAQTLVVNPEVERNEQAKFINFNLNNQTKTPLYCRKISIPNVRYTKNGEYYDSLEAKISDVFIDKNNITNKIQEKSDYLLELFKNDHDFELDIDRDSVIKDCEISESRMSWIYVIDDKTKCNSATVEIVPFNIDFGNEALIMKDQLIKNVNDSNYKFYQNSFTRDALKVDSKAIYLQTETDGVVNIIKIKDFEQGGNESFAGSLWLDDVKFIFYTLDLDGFKLYQVHRENGKYEVSPGINLFSFTKAFADKYESLQYENKELIKNEILRNFDKIRGSFLTYNFYNQDFETVRVLFTVRLPSFYIVDTMYDFTKQKWTTPKLQINNYESSHFIIYKMMDINIASNSIRSDNNLAYNRFKKELATDDYANALKSKTSESFKNFKVQAFNNQLSYSFNDTPKKIDGFCNIVQIYSDKIEAQRGRNIDALLKGHVLLIDSVMKNNYSLTLDLISKGANVNLKDILGNNALWYSVGQNNQKFLTLLLASGANPNETDARGNTTIMREIKMRFRGFNKYPSEIQQQMILLGRKNISLLLKYGAKLNMKNKDEKSAMDLALDLGVYESLKDFL